MNVAIIPARGGSVRIPRKNIRLFHGKPILAYSIAAAKASDLFLHVMVSTDDEEIAQVALDHGAGVVWRGDEMASENVGTQEVTCHAIRRYSNPADFACCIYATAPLMLPSDLLSGFERLGIRDNRYTFSVGPDGNDAGQWYWGTRSAFLSGVPLEGNSEKYVLPASRVCDINTEDDWARAEAMYAALRKASDSPVLVEAIREGAGLGIDPPDSRWRSGDLIATRVATSQQQQDE